jgi:uncharacterized membrane protein
MANFASKFSRRTIALFWMVLVGIIIGVLIAKEQISILYVLVTLALVVLLLIVGFADLEKAATRMQEERNEG